MPESQRSIFQFNEKIIGKQTFQRLLRVNTSGILSQTRGDRSMPRYLKSLQDMNALKVAVPTSPQGYTTARIEARAVRCRKPESLTCVAYKHRKTACEPIAH